MFNWKISAAAILGASLAVLAVAGLSSSYVVPLDHDGLQYEKRPVDDPITRLQKGVASGEVKLSLIRRGVIWRRS